MIMVERGVSADEAFDVLREMSQRQNTKLRTVAAELIADTLARRTTARRTGPG
jgi:AmiR/NasT family two-component response regulator